ncbi:MAG: hypothetical protein Q4G69_03540 [Planctomycetia bacterium]|nr:hypothetical protein [Planctomycetia bacterium]
MQEFLKYNAIEKRKDYYLVSCLIEVLVDDSVITSWYEEYCDATNSVPEGSRIIIDFSRTKILSSIAFQRFIEIYYSLKNRKIAFGFSGMNDTIVGVMKMTCLDRIFVLGNNIVDVFDKLANR